MDRVGEWAKQIEDRAKAELFPNWRDVAHTGVENRGKQESVVRLRVDLRKATGCHSLNIWGLATDGLEEVGTARCAGGGAVAVFGDKKEGGCDDGGGGRNVEGAVAIAAGANDIDQASAVGTMLEVTGTDRFAKFLTGWLGGSITHAGGALSKDEGIAVEVGVGEEGEEGGYLDGRKGVGENKGESGGDGLSESVRVESVGSGGVGYEVLEEGRNRGRLKRIGAC